MQELDRILGSSGMDIGGLAARFGISPEQATAALRSLAPAVAGGMQKRADDGSLAPVAEAGDTADQPDTETGNGVLGHIFGGKDVSRQVADHAAGQTGLPSTLLKAMLPVVAAMMARRVAQGGGAGGGGLGGIVGALLGGGSANGSGGLGGLGSLLGGGNPLDAILGGRR